MWILLVNPVVSFANFYSILIGLNDTKISIYIKHSHGKLIFIYFLLFRNTFTLVAVKWKMNKENYLEIYSHSLNKENVKYLKLIPKYMVWLLYRIYVYENITKVNLLLFYLNGTKNSILYSMKFFKKICSHFYLMLK